jgi:hypothetical protein
MLSRGENYHNDLFRTARAPGVIIKNLQNMHERPQRRMELEHQDRAARLQGAGVSGPGGPPRGVTRTPFFSFLEFRLGPRVWSGSAIRPATPHASAASWPFPFSLCRHLLSAGSWRDPSGPTPRAETASLGCMDPMHRFRALSPRSRAVSRELSQFGRQVGFSAPAAHVARKSRIFWRISRAGTFNRR